MHEKLREMHDFKNKKTKLETLLALHGFVLPKFHCDLNPIERESGPTNTAISKFWLVLR